MKKEILIKKIKSIIDKHNTFSISDVEGSDSPIISSIGDHSICVESFKHNSVDVIEYINGFEFSSGIIPYDNLTARVLKQILDVCNDYVESK